ncbi:MAG: Sec-independent protein translocase subunit TatA [Jatrophihabitans sp.]|uniref:Sec-independent protein translocase subunit TatA n=1 Tax=Jatrophihabitans sp. TaxID=1932789 RepID=UPI003F7CDDA1
MEFFSPGHLIVIAIVALVLFFGWKQLPDMARSLGRSMRIFRTEIKGMSEDDKKRAEHAERTAEQPKAIEAPRVVEPEGGLAHTVAETAPRPRPRPTPQGSQG